jgi:hypothetical protein
MARRTRIPTEADWAGYKDDLEASYAHRFMLGKSIDELAHRFKNSPIERGAELLYMPRRAFQYYVFAFAVILESPLEGAGQSDCASVFLRLLCNREKSDPGSVAQIYPALRGTVEHVSANQAFFDADQDIYGDFRELAVELKTLCQASAS